MGCKRGKDISILATDFSDLDKEMELWEEKRNKKIEIYRKYAELVKMLEQYLLICDTLDQPKIKKEIKKLKKMQSKYHVPSILSMKFEKTKTSEKKKVLNFRNGE